MRCFLKVALFSTLSPALTGIADIGDYYDAVDQVNKHLAYAGNPHHSLACEGTKLALSCGDGVCRPEEGENAINCPADCLDSPVKSYDDSIVCSAVQEYYEPNSISQVQQIIRHAAYAGLSVRVVGSRHSTNDHYCNDGIAISTKNLNRIVGILRETDGSESVVVEPGVKMGELASWLHLKKRSLGYAQLGFRLATVGGAVANAAHGSSPKHTAIISNIVRAITLIDDRGNIREVNENRGPNDDLRSARAHLGLLGPVVRIKLKIVPQFRLRVQVTEDDDNTLLGPTGVFGLVKGCDFALINWFPNTNRFIKTCGMQTTLLPDAQAEQTLLTPPIPPSLSQPFKVALHYGMCYEPLNEALEELRYLQLLWIPPFQKANELGELTSTTNAVGYSHMMMSSSLIQTDNKFFTDDWELAVPFSKAQNALRAVSEYAAHSGMRLPLIGLFLRFAPSDDLALLAHTTSLGAFKKGEPVLFIEFPTPSPVGFSTRMTNAINAIYENLATMLMLDFDARPHWGKNKNFVYDLQNQLQVYGDNFKRFQKVKDKFDPSGMFMTPFGINAGFR